MNSNRITKLYSLFLNLVLLLTLTNLSVEVNAQCGVNTPTFIVDLSSNPDTTWTSPDTIRLDTCCGATAPDKCVRFLLTLNANAVGIKFDVCDGALPPGALFYQIGCGTKYPVGDVLCLSGAGPHSITFCKPGNNQNKYCITSIPKASPGPPISVNDGCKGTLYCTGYDDTTITWRSVAPGTPGAYDSYLDCTQDCDTVQVTAQPGYPAFVDFEVCGRTIGECDTSPTCDTIRASFFSTLKATIVPENPTVCFGAPHTTIGVTPSGGSAPYTYNWSTGDTTQFINVNVGTYWVELGDTSGCPPTYDTVTVTSFANTIQANAGNDTTFCQQYFPIPLNGSVIAASGGTWFGGSGTFTPHQDSLQTNYTPSSTEINSGNISLYLRTTGNGSCPADTDTVHIAIPSFTAIFSLTTADVSCFGGNDGWGTVGGSGIDSLSWDTSITTINLDSALLLSADTYSLTIIDTNLCSVDTNFIIVEPLPLVIDSIVADSSLCFGDSTGAITVFASGGTSPYHYLWDANANSQTSMQASALSAGSYRVSVSDTNGCIIDTQSTVLEPIAISIQGSQVNVACFGDSTGQATALGSGGSPGYVYIWTIGSQQDSNQTTTQLYADTFNVNVVDQNGCSSDSNFIITEPPVLRIDSIHTFPVQCYGDTTGSAYVLSSGGSGPHSYSWSGGSANLDSVTALTSGSYSVTVQDTNGCSVTDSFNIVEPSPLQINLGFDSVQCYSGQDGKAWVIATGGSLPYTYQWDTSITNATADTAYNLKAGSYWIQVIDSNSCNIDSTILIPEPDSLSLSLQKMDALCSGGNEGWIKASLSGGSPGYSYLWSPNSAGQGNDSIYQLEAGKYALTATDDNGCIISDSLIILEPSPIDVILSKSSNDTVCTGDQVIFSTLVSGGTPPYSYLWSDSSTADSLVVIASFSATFSVTVTDVNNCPIDVDSLSIVVLNLFSDSIETENTSPVCLGESVDVSGFHSGTYPPYTYTWSPQIGTGIGTHTYTPNSSEYVIFSVTDRCNNSVLDSTFVTVHPLPLLDVADSGYDGCVELNVKFTNDEHQSDYVYQWDFGDGNTSTESEPEHLYETPGIYTVQVEVTNQHGCKVSNNDLITINVWPRPTSIISSDRNSTDINDPVFILNDESIGSITRLWANQDSMLGDANPLTVTYNDTGTYYVNHWAINEYLCRDSSVIRLVINPDHIIEIPNAFRPNPNGPNGGQYNPDNIDDAIFFPFTDYVDEFHMMVYNRWGELVFQSFDVTIGWDGYYKGEMSQQDVYFWKVEVVYTDGVEKTLVGDVTLLH